MSTGGQETVAWVHLQSNSMQYALKFKAREGRSDKNWVIELREAKILRNLKHSFILKYVDFNMLIWLHLNPHISTKE